MKKLDAKRVVLARGISAAALAAALTVAAPAMAQTSSSLRGHVDGATAGTTITITDNNTGQKVTATTDANGNYFVPGLRPSTYNVEAPGADAATVVVPVGQTVVYDIAAPTDSSNQIVVTGAKGRTEVRTATITTNVTPAQMENLPQSDRNFLNFAALAPGVNVSPPGSNRQVQAGAVSPDNTNTFIDGFSLKNPINHGGLSGQNFSQGNPFPQLAVQEFAVSTQNFKAEYEQAGSAIITAVTKTGGQEFHGDLFGEWQPKSFVGRPYFDRPGNANNPNGTIAKPDYNRWQFGADLGGPIIKDVLHFYGAFEGMNRTSPSTTVNFSAPVPASIISQYNGSYPQDFKQRLYFGKLTFFATANDTVNLSAFIRNEKNLADFGGTAVPSHGHYLNNNVKNFIADWNHRGENWLNEMQISYSKVDNGTPRTTDGPEIVLSNGTDFGTIAALGTNSFEQNDHQESFTVKNNVTFYGGNHVFKMGAKVSFNKYERTEDSYSNGGYFFNAAGYTGFDSSTPYGARVSVIDFRPATANNTQIGAFVQDDWTPDEHWTFNLGLRWDFETNAKNEKFVTPQNIRTALMNYPGWQAAGINPNDYISTGENRHAFWGAIQPRLGVSYDVNGDRDLVFFAGAGRYYDRPLFITSGIETVKSYYQKVVTLNFCGPGTATPVCPGVLPANMIPWSAGLRNVDALRAAATATGLGGDVWLLNNDTKLPFSDQFNIGIRKRFGQIQTSIAFSHVRSHNIFRYVRGNRLPNGTYTSQGDQWIEDNFPAAGQLPGFSGKLNIGDNHGKAVYNAVYITAEKPFTANSTWGFNTSITLQRARTNVAQELANNDEFYNGPRVDAYGWNYVQGVEKYRFVGTGIVRGPFDTVLSGTLTLSSGPAFGNIIFKANPPENACCYGNMGGVFFPKETFAYSNLDLRIAKKFKMPFANSHELEVSFAAFNVFDTVNRNYSAWGAGSGENPTFEENGTVGNARSFQVGAKYKF
ncbi:TonB-dependent receptor [Sphingomonas sp. HITSZ_GF]|uniref:TonB-dependent receptor n=1 Tax=Sphingomonas sp. HITSZ_GF TaxID=3037247 RepID=UPI00240E1152|nr:carboxypeptidase regulatory-like domain-containing protein [Sphingomonas sp. HITSZ_GF]MDG2535347.1 TonB-dependent receptor [Sphingomonas sp. HITSZ_GF]